MVNSIYTFSRNYILPKVHISIDLVLSTLSVEIIFFQSNNKLSEVLISTLSVEIIFFQSRNSSFLPNLS